MIVMKLNPEPFEKIKSHKKIWEVRLNDDKRKGIHIGDRILFMDNGNIVEQGTPEEIFSNPKNPRTIDFLSKVL